MLALHEVYSSYATMQVLFGVTLEVRPGESVCLLGRNGMGKTTIFRAITGNVAVKSGKIEFNAKDISSKSIFERARLGMRYIPDIRGVFDNLTVLENLQLAKLRTNRNADISEVIDLFPEFKYRLNQRAGTLSGGERKLLSISMSIISKPKLAILDELSEGVAPLVLERISSALVELKKKGAMILLAEQNVQFGCKSADRVYIVRKGKVVYESNVEKFLQSNAIDEHIGLST